MAARARLAAGCGQLLFLCELECVARGSDRRFRDRRLYSWSADRSVGFANSPEISSHRQHRLESRPAGLLQIRQFFRGFAGTASFCGRTSSLSSDLPIGISFYTFEAISYTVDVYRGRIRAERNLINFILFITFFPRLIAGPIIRGRQFLPQVPRAQHWDWARLHLGANFFLLGLIKKLVIADRLAVFVDPVYANPAAYSSGAAWVAVFAYIIQIYCDFSGYSDMAVGLGHALGYKLPQNFRMPYFAPNITELWRRFVGHHIFQTFCRRRLMLRDWLQTGPGTVLRVWITFCAFALSGVLFRARDFEVAQTFFGRLLAFSPGKFFPQSLSIFWSLMAIVFLAHLFVRFGLWNGLWSRAPAYARGFAYASALSLCLMLSPDAGKAFIYFQF